MHPQQLKKKALRPIPLRNPDRLSTRSNSYLKTRIRGPRLRNAAPILALIELSRRLHQAYAQAYDKQAADWLLPQNPASTISSLQDAAKALTKKKLKNKDCQKDLAALGVTADQVRQGALNANFINGVGSTVSRSSLYATSPVESVRQAGAALTGTVGDWLSQPGHVASSQLGGPNIYVDPAKIKPADYFQNLGVAFHEVLHNITGLTDPDIQRALHLKETDDSDNITKRLIRDCL